MKRLFLIGLGVIVLGSAALLYLNRGEISIALVRHVATRIVGGDALATLPDGLHAGFCGTGSPLVDPKRSGPCTVIIAGKRLFIVDAGRGAADVLWRMTVAPGAIEAVLLTHFHSDHIDGLGQLAEQRWAGAMAHAPLPVYAPPGVERVVNGFNEAYAENGGYRTAHHGADIVPPSGFGLEAHAFALPDDGASVVVLESDGLKITAFRVDHGPVHPAVGYRFDYKGRSIVVSGDTAKSTDLVRASTGADLLIHEGLSPRLVKVLEDAARTTGHENLRRIFHDILSYHTAPSDAADEATEAHVKALAFTHIIPPLPLASLEGPFLGDARKHFSGPLFIARDGDLVSLPVSGGMTRKNILN